MDTFTVETSNIKVVKKDFVPKEEDVLDFRQELADLKRRFHSVITLAEERVSKWERILLKGKI